MSDQRDDALDRERDLREEEQKIREHEPAERSPKERQGPERAEKPAPPGQVQQPRG
jgi:hypothetical protein